MSLCHYDVKRRQILWMTFCNILSLLNKQASKHKIYRWQMDKSKGRVT